MLVDIGTRPWNPNDHLKVYRRIVRQDDIPLTVTWSEDSGNVFLLDCISGELDDINYWAYVDITAGERAGIADLHGDILKAYVDHCVWTRNRVIIARAEGFRITHTSVIQRLYPKPDEVVREVFRDIG